MLTSATIVRQKTDTCTKT